LPGYRLQHKQSFAINLSNPCIFIVACIYGQNVCANKQEDAFNRHVASCNLLNIGVVNHVAGCILFITACNLFVAACNMLVNACDLLVTPCNLFVNACNMLVGISNVLVFACVLPVAANILLFNSG